MTKDLVFTSASQDSKSAISLPTNIVHMLGKRETAIQQDTKVLEVFLLFDYITVDFYFNMGTLSDLLCVLKSMNLVFLVFKVNLLV